MSRPSQSSDPVFAVLDPLVREGVLGAHQADRVYAELGRRLPTAPVDDGRLPTLPAGWARPRLLAGLAGLGTALTLAAFLIAATVLAEQDFAWKTFLAMAAVVVVSFAAAVGCAVRMPRTRHSRWLTGAFASLAVLSAGWTAITTGDSNAVVYLAGALMVAGGVATYWWTRSHPATLLAALGGLVVVGQLFSDTLTPSPGLGLGDITTAGVGVLVYGLAVGAVGWRFACRTTTALAGGAIALVAMYYVIFTLGTFAAVAAVFGPGRREAFGDIRSDILLAMVLGLLVTVGLVVAHAVTGHVGLLVEAFLGAAGLPALAVLLSRGEHPLRWAFAVGVVGTAVGAIAAWGLLRRGADDVVPPVPGDQPSGPPPAHLGAGETVVW